MIRFVLPAGLLVVLGSACSHPADSRASDQPDAASGDAANVTTPPRPQALAPEKVAAVVNGDHLAPYSGPTGTVRGRVTITGDPPPTTPMRASRKCGEAMATYGKLFRVGQDHALADALVAVTGYDGYVPARSEASKMTIHGCALARRTIVATFGQHIDIANLDKTETFIPILQGAPQIAMLVAVPGGDPIRLWPLEPGHYAIRDELPQHAYLFADVYVLKFATHDVTGLDGMYEIPGVPVGKVHVNAKLPSTGKAVGKTVEIKPGENIVDLELTFDKDKDTPPPKAKP